MPPSHGLHPPLQESVPPLSLIWPHLASSYLNWPRFVWTATGRSRGELGRFAAHVAVRRGCVRPRCTRNEVSWLGQMKWGEMKVWYERSFDCSAVLAVPGNGVQCCECRLSNSVEWKSWLCIGWRQNRTTAIVRNFAKCWPVVPYTVAYKRVGFCTEYFAKGSIYCKVLRFGLQSIMSMGHDSRP